MKISLSKLATIVNGRLSGNGELEIISVSSLEHATSNSITFFGDRKKKQQLKVSGAGAVLIRDEHKELFPGNKIIVTDPYLAHAQISKLFRRALLSPQSGVHETAVVSAGAILGSQVTVGAYSTIAEGVKLGNGVVICNNVNIGEEVEIGDATVIEDQVVIYESCKIGKRCCLSAGVVIGASGFGYVPDNGKWQKIEQLGSVVIGDDVDVGANTTVDRGALENTIIGNGVKLDNQIQIAHNVVVGDNTIIAGCSGIAGSAVIGQRCKLGGRVSILGHLEIADDVTIFSNSMVTKTITLPGEYAFAIGVQPVEQWRKNAAIIRRLDKLVEQVKSLGMDKPQT